MVGVWSQFQRVWTGWVSFTCTYWVHNKPCLQTCIGWQCMHTEKWSISAQCYYKLQVMMVQPRKQAICFLFGWLDSQNPKGLQRHCAVGSEDDNSPLWNGTQPHKGQSKEGLRIHSDSSWSLYWRTQWRPEEMSAIFQCPRLVLQSHRGLGQSLPEFRVSLQVWCISILLTQRYLVKKRKIWYNFVWTMQA